MATAHPKLPSRAGVSRLPAFRGSPSCAEIDWNLVLHRMLSCQMTRWQPQSEVMAETLTVFGEFLVAFFLWSACSCA